MSFDRNHVVEITRTWVGTPYHHQASLRGVGADCLGLLRGVYTELYGHDPYLDAPLRYSPNWAEGTGGDTLLDAAKKYLTHTSVWEPGDVLVFRIKNANYAKHCAIVTAHDTMIHAVSGRTVQETTIGAWATRVAGAFSFVGVS